MDKFQRLVANIKALDYDEIRTLWNKYCDDGTGDDDECICDDQEFFWDNCAGNSTYELMRIAADGDIDLDQDYVMHTDCEGYQTFEASEILDYVCVEDIANWLLDYEEKAVMRDYGISPEISKEDICTTLCICISGLTHAIEDANNNQITSVKGNLNQQIERLTQLHKDIEELFDTNKD